MKSPKMPTVTSSSSSIQNSHNQSSSLSNDDSHQEGRSQCNHHYHNHNCHGAMTHPSRKRGRLRRMGGSNNHHRFISSLFSGRRCSDAFVTLCVVTFVTVIFQAQMTHQRPLEGQSDAEFVVDTDRSHHADSSHQSHGAVEKDDLTGAMVSAANFSTDNRYEKGGSETPGAQNTPSPSKAKNLVVKTRSFLPYPINFWDPYLLKLIQQKSNRKKLHSPNTNLPISIYGTDVMIWPELCMGSKGRCNVLFMDIILKIIRRRNS